MIVNADVKSLELVAVADLSGDTVLSTELWNKFDTHADNQKKFNLPERVVAKRFVFKLIYGATDFGFVQDSDFLEVGLSQKQWADVIEAFYDKYKGIKKWHDSLLLEAMRHGFIEIPSGRYFTYRAGVNGRWPLTTIKNYPVQGFGADLVKLARVEAYRRFKESRLEGVFMGTVHDSLKFDVPEENVYNVSKILKDSIEKVPQLCKEAWNYNFELPLTCEIKVGHNQKDLTELTI